MIKMAGNKKDSFLRPLKVGDLELVLKWRNSDSVRLSMLSTHLITEEEHRSWFFNLDNNSCRYLIFEYKQTPVGLVNFTEIDRNNNRCNWGFYLGENGTPQGTGFLMGYLSMEYVFSSLKIKKLCSQVLSNNETSINFHYKLGFKQEGQLLKHVLHNGIYKDILLFALFNNEWEKIKDDLLVL